MTDTPREQDRYRKARRAGLVILAVLALLILIPFGIWLAARPSTPDGFYRDGPVAELRPGTAVRSEPFARSVPAGVSAWRILYVTTRRDGRPALASALVLAPASAPEGPRRVVAWAHGTTGVAPGCAPSMMKKPFADMPAFQAALDAGWTIVAPDYVGLGAGRDHAYLVGVEAGRSVLDAVRAAGGLKGLEGPMQVVVWGHSQGGNSALWSGALAPSYAPDLNLRGVAALAPASDLPALLRQAKSSMFGKIVSAFVVTGYTSAYPGLDAWTYVAPKDRGLTRDIAGRCVGGLPTLVSAAQTLFLPKAGVFTQDPATGELGRRLAENTPNGPIPAPVFIAQGLKDELVSPQVQAAYAARRCAAGQALDYRTYKGRDHMSVLGKRSQAPADLMAWTEARFEGSPAASTCAAPAAR